MMKKVLISCLAVVALVAILAGEGWAREVSSTIRGGYINTVAGEIKVLRAVGENLVYIKVLGEEVRGLGRILVVDASGYVRQYQKYYLDRSGVTVRSAAMIDKVVFINSEKKIIGGINLSSTEIDVLLQKNRTLAQAGSLYKELRQNKKNIVQAYRDSIDVLVNAYDETEEDKEEIFLASVGMLAGNNVKLLSADIIEAARQGFEDSIFATREYEDVEKALIGVSLVADDGNTGGGPQGLVEDDGNTGGGPQGLVADDGNTGGGPQGLVEDDGNTGGGPQGLILHGVVDGNFDTSLVEDLGIDGDLLMIIK